MEYENRHVLFCDILGFSEAVKNKSITVEEIFGIMRDLRNYMTAANILESDPTQSSDGNSYTIISIAEHFSDCIVISVEATNLGVIWLCEVASQLQEIIIKKGFLCRGSITSGEIWHKNSTIYGPAFIEAVELEKSTKYPRIEISETAFKWFMTSDNEEDFEIVKIRKSQLISIGEDGVTGIDPFSNLKIYSGKKSIPTAVSDLLDVWSKVISKGLSHPDDCVLEKYNWMKTEYNKLVEGKNISLMPFRGYPSLKMSIIEYKRQENN